MDQFTGRIADRTVKAHADAEYGFVVEQVFGLMNEQAKAGVAVFEGMTIQFGWTRFTLKNLDGDLTLLEPDFENDPTANLRKDLRCSIAVYLRQQALIADLGLSTWSPVPFYDDVVAAHGALAAPRIIAKHYEAADESGWVIFDAETTHTLTEDSLAEQYGKIAVWRLLKDRPELLDVLALPEGFTVFLNGPAVERVINEQGEEWS